MQDSVKFSKLSLELRKFEPSEWETYAGIRNQVFLNDQVSVQELRAFDDSIDRTKFYQQRYTCINRDTGETVGFGNIGQMIWMFNPHRYACGIVVARQHQNKGVGTYIYDTLMKHLSELQAREVWAFSKEDMPGSLRFIQKRGFQERLRVWESWLVPASVDLSKFTHYIEKSKQAGFEISTLSQELIDDPNCYRKLYELNQTLFADVPMPEAFTPLPYEQWLKFDMKDPGLVADAYTIAKHGDKYVGLSTARRLDKEPHSLHQLLTGVRREYRGNGIAYAMKLRVLEWARENGIERIKTENATNNAPMLKINTKLGFQNRVGQISYSRLL